LLLLAYGLASVAQKESFLPRHPGTGTLRTGEVSFYVSRIMDRI
jgi:hypothetical protein